MSDTKEIGKMDMFNVINGNITLRIKENESILTNIRNCRLIFEPGDIPVHFNVYRIEQLSEYGRSASPEEITYLKQKGVRS